ncbi:MAG: cell division protein FtsQ/DivIB [Gemmatimonadota bacterium]
MTRATRRRIAVIGSAAALGVLSPLWGPLVLRNIPIFGVEEVYVHDVRYLGEADVRELAGLDASNSVWDDMAPVEARLIEHPVILDARIRRGGLHRLDITIREVQALAFVATPALVPVDAGGRAIPLDPSEHALDLPILVGGELVGGRVEPEPARRALVVLDRLNALDSAFTRQISEMRPLGAESVEFRLLPGSPLERVILPFSEIDVAFQRVGVAVTLAEARGPVRDADARFENEVVIRMGKHR